MELEIIIGLEIHVQMNTKTKMFCSCDNDSFRKEPNSNICPICLGFPGMLPVLNQEALSKGMMSALALNLELQKFSKFDRKQYFYPDNPKGYQISQYDEPLAKNGYLEIVNEFGVTKKIRINRLHLEDDAGKLTHEETATLLDFNRAGTPLMEIVSEPDLRSALEARLYAEKMRNILRFVGSSDCDMEKGMMRFDASISLRPMGDNELYPRTEIKNLNSFKFLEEALNYEIKKQKELWEEGNPPKDQVTAGWVEKLGITTVLRDKEDAADYRYFPEPDLPPIILAEAEITDLKKRLPELPNEKLRKYVEAYGIKTDDAVILTEDLRLALFFEKVVTLSKDPIKSANWVLSVLLGEMRAKVVDFEQILLTPEMLASIIEMVNSGKLSSKMAKEIFMEVFETGKNPEQIVQERGLVQISDDSELRKICTEVLLAFPEVVNDILNGKDKAFGRLVGEVMKKSQGKANPAMINSILREKIAK